MTTEVGSASEVKKESEPLGADATKEKPKEVAENQQNQSSDPEEEKGSQSSPTAESQSSPRRQKREKDPSESRGISRFIPPWLKKQKSYTLVAAKDGGDKKEPAQAVVEEILDQEQSLPEGERQAKGDAEETAQGKEQEVKVDVKEEKPSVSCPEAQPAEGVSKEREEKAKEMKEDKSEEVAKRETKEVQTNELKAEKAFQKASKKTKTVQCKVMLLDGTEYSCDLEKRVKGQVLFDKVCEHLNLLEKDYFGLLFQESPEQKNWLDPAKEIKRQLRKYVNSKRLLFRFFVSLYRLVSPEQPPKAKFLTLGSKFRYSGRTQAQTRQASTLIDRPAPHFERTSSKRVSRSLDGAPVGVVDQSLMKDFPGPAGEVSAYGPGIVSPAMVQDGDGRRELRSPTKAPHVQFIEGKKNSLRVEGDNIYVRHSNLMLEDLDKAQEDILRHQASISELKRNFMESTPEPRPNEWEKRRITPLSLQTQGRKGDHLFKDILSVKEKHQMAATRTVEGKVQETDKSLEEEITSILLSEKGFADSLRAPFISATTRTAEGAVVNCSAPPETLSSSPFSRLPEKRAPESEGPCTGASDAVKSSHETLNVVEEKKQAEVGKDERVITEEMNGKELSPGSGPGEMRKVEPLTQKDSTSLSSESSHGSESEEEDGGEYRPHHRVTAGTIREEREEEDEEVEEEAGRAAQVVEREEPVPEASPVRQAGASVSAVETVIRENVGAPQIPAEKSVNEGAVKQDMSEETEDEQHTVNGEVSHVDIDVLPQIICCSEPPVVKTEMVTISDASQRTEISTKEVPIVQTETKTITYESPQVQKL
ncbi:band 4.1-like protein 2 [Leptonychotes weddellii]|uniref:Band 4.1-like protein 2 n=1 Tax=Leptonychotes weddellii TaxID=9713 RepID=A0A7F8QB40_LEPWE|nr:band 4.1-like protein 2 [Leptonychotes weddellii]